ncbi:MAG: AMP-binding protein, partial [Ilumatobacteraceae bacterium]|nr:AMP-binding protein [Ilumatobacteraceae bacterium]
MTIDRLLDLRAADSADTTFLRFSAGDLTFGEARRRSMGLARGLADLGVQRGQLVPVLMANGPDFAITWLALCTLGAVSTLLNTEFRGPALVHALNLSGAETVVVDARFVPHLSEVLPDLVCLRRVVVVGRTAGVDKMLTGMEVLDHSALCTDDSSVIPSLHTFADPAMVLFTSGTTGPSKGCVLSHRYAVRQA